MNGYAKCKMIKMFFSSLLGSIRRNPLTFVVLVALICAAPWLFGALALVIVALLLVSLLSWFSLIWRVRDAQRTMEREMDEQQRAQRHWYDFGRRSQREGDITVTETEVTRKRVSDDVGEYVDFKEVRSESDKQQ